MIFMAVATIWCFPITKMKLPRLKAPLAWISLHKKGPFIKALIPRSFRKAHALSKISVKIPFGPKKLGTKFTHKKLGREVRICNLKDG